MQWLTGYKNTKIQKKKTYTYAAYKRISSDLKPQTESERMEKAIP